MNIYKLLLTAWLIVFGLICLAYSPQQVEGQSSTLNTSTAENWQKEPWTNNDIIYRQVIDAVRMQLALGYKAKDLAKQYRADAEMNYSTGLPEDPVAVFRYGYASYLAAKLEKDTSHLADASNAMNTVRPTYSYQFARLHFLLHTRSGDIFNLKQVGERLVKRDPNDIDVIYYLVGLLDVGKSAQDRHLAEKYLAQLFQQIPHTKRYKVYAQKGYVYDIAHAEGHDPKDGDTAIAAYKTFLKLAPPNDDYRASAISHIHSVEMMQRTLRRMQKKEAPQAAASHR